MTTITDRSNDAGGSLSALVRSNSDFTRFWTGQAVSALGNAVTFLALPLLVFKLTGSAMNLALATMSAMLPYLLFGLIIGAWVDRADRKRVMITVDILRAAAIATIPLLAWVDGLSVWWVYGIAFVNSTLTIFFDSCEFAAIPNLVATEDLVSANGRIQASYSAAMAVGPLVAGASLAVIEVETLLLLDAGSFLVSVLSLALIRAPFNTEPGTRPTTSLRGDLVEGLRFVLRHPVLRAISIMMVVVNFVSTSVMAQLVLFADVRLNAGESRIGWLFSASGVGVVVLALLAGGLRRRWSFSRVALGALALYGLFIALLGLTTSYWMALPIMALLSGCAVLFNINTGSLRQAIVPNAMLGRVASIATVLATSASPIGSLLGGVLIERTGDIALVYVAIGVVTAVIPLVFAFTALGHAARYLPAVPAADATEIAA